MPVLVVAAALVDDTAAPGRLLAARRSAPAALAGRWELPGGKVEPGESPQQALHRELAEELGIAAALGPELTGPLGGRDLLDGRDLPVGPGPGVGPGSRPEPDPLAEPDLLPDPDPLRGAWPLGPGLVMRVWLATVTAGEPRPLADHDELRWLERAAWLSVPWLDPDVPIVRALDALPRPTA